MFQLFLQTAQLSDTDWERAYAQIQSLLAGFPLPLLRIESYNGFSSKLDKEHLDLTEHAGTLEERLSFFGDAMSYTRQFTVYFYRDWAKQQAEGMRGEPLDPARPLLWYPGTVQRNDGSPPQANGAAIGRYGYAEHEGCLYRYALLAIGILLENLFPGRALVIDHEQTEEDSLAMCQWLEGHFGGSFAPPLYLDQGRLLAQLGDQYPEPRELVARLDQLFPRQYLTNMRLALAEVGYEPTLSYYAEVLSTNLFGTFGFSDVWMPWLAATEDLPQTLALIEASRKRLLADPGPEPQAEAAKYDLTRLLRSLLDKFILWTAVQREALAAFPTNQQTLETGQSDLWDSLFRISGYRMDICPVYASPEELLEAFALHAPAQGAEFKAIIERWQAEHADDHARLVAQLRQTVEAAAASSPTLPALTPLEAARAEACEALIAQYEPHAQFLITKALRRNPTYAHFEPELQTLYEKLDTFWQDPEQSSTLTVLQKHTAQQHRDYLYRRLKGLSQSVPVGFEARLAQETDISLLLHLHLLLGVKLYQRSEAYLRHRVLQEPARWEAWRGKERVGFG